LWGVVNNTGFYFIIVGVGLVGQWRETGFLPRYLIGGEDIGKNPVSEIVKAASL
jgi:hypothetical protein